MPVFSSRSTKDSGVRKIVNNHACNGSFIVSAGVGNQGGIMNIVVCLKQVFSTEAKIRLAPVGKSVIEDQVEWIVNPYDEFAIEEALKIREAKGGGSITAITIGPDRCATILRSAMALGVDKALHLKDPLFESLDALGTAHVLAAAIKKLSADIILFGKQGVGMDQGMVQAMVAEILDLPLANIVTKVTIDGNTARCLREVDDGAEVVDCALPVVISTQKGLNEPRMANLKGIMAAKKKPIDVWTTEDLGLDAAFLGSPTLVHEKYELPPPRTAGKILQGTPEEAARELVALLRNDARVI